MKKIIILGDIILDRYVFGEVERLNPESCIPLVDVTKEEYRLGGAANVANNIKALGGDPVLIGTVGDDYDGDKIRELLTYKEIEHHIATDTKPTIVKTRVVVNGQQLIRYDKEDRSNINSLATDSIINYIRSNVNNCILVISDYAKGTITEEIINSLSDLNCKILIDPKPKNEKIYPSAFLIKPNKKEFEKMKFKVSKFDNVLVTRGKEGMRLYKQNIDGYLTIPGIVEQVYDVCGAGDTVIATIAHFLNRGKSLLGSIQIGNLAASIVVKKVGTSCIEEAELIMYEEL